MAANFESGFFVRTPAWHGLGTVINEAPNSDDALRIAGLDWTVKQAPAFMEIDGVRRPTHFFMNYRDSDKSCLGVVKGQYKIVQNHEAFAFTDELIGTGDVRYETAGSLAGGKQVWMLAKMPETSVLGDAIVPYLLFSNSHDGSAAVRVTMTNTRVVCQNTLNLALANARRIWSFTHKGDMESKLEDARKTLQNAQEYMTEFNKEAERLAKITFTRQQVQDLLNKLFPVDENDDITKRRVNNMIYLREGFKFAMQQEDICQFDGTAYGIINAASDFVGHCKPLRLTETHQEKVLQSFMNGNSFIDKVYSLVAA
jgi:phage/plasmid-like protein (TIGR03299 family)